MASNSFRMHAFLFFALCRRVPKCRTTPTTPRHRNLGVRFVLELQMEASACYKAAAARGTRPPLETRLERKPVAAQQAGLARLPTRTTKELHQLRPVTHSWCYRNAHPRGAHFGRPADREQRPILRGPILNRGLIFSCPGEDDKTHPSPPPTRHASSSSERRFRVR